MYLLDVARRILFGGFDGMFGEWMQEWSFEHLHLTLRFSWLHEVTDGEKVILRSLIIFLIKLFLLLVWWYLGIVRTGFVIVFLF